MHIINTKEFRANQKKYFDLAIKEDVIIRRGRKQAFVLVPLDGDEYTITPELQARIDKAREQYEKVNFVVQTSGVGGQTSLNRNHQERTLVRI